MKRTSTWSCSNYKYGEYQSCTLSKIIYWIISLKVFITHQLYLKMIIMVFQFELEDIDVENFDISNIQILQQLP